MCRGWVGGIQGLECCGARERATPVQWCVCTRSVRLGADVGGLHNGRRMHDRLGTEGAGGRRGCKCADNANMTWVPITASRNGLPEFRDHDRWDGTDLGHRDEPGRWLVRSPCTCILPPTLPCAVPHGRAYRSIPRHHDIAIMSHRARSATVRPVGAPANSPTVPAGTHQYHGTGQQCRPVLASTMLAAARAPS